MLPRFRNYAIASDLAEKLGSGQQPITSFLYKNNSEDVEDPENMFVAADLTGLKKKMISALSPFGFPTAPLERKDTATVDTMLAGILYDHLLLKNCLPKNS